MNDIIVTNKIVESKIFAVPKAKFVKGFKIAALTHKKNDLNFLGDFQLEKEQIADLKQHMSNFGMDELVYLNTCNRVEVLVYANEGYTKKQAAQFLKYIASINNNHSVSEEDLITKMDWFEGVCAVEHIYRVASSLDSMVVGEREIITQFRKAFEMAWENQLAGDFLRLLSRSTIETAKQVFTETSIARHPVSVVSLAYHQFEEHMPNRDARIVMIGAGQTNRSMFKFLEKAGYKNVWVYNRTQAKAEALTRSANNARALSDLPSHQEGVDAILTCTGATTAHVTKDLLANIDKEDSLKCIVDLSVPNDIDKEVLNHGYHTILVEDVQKIASRNIKEREKEVKVCEDIISIKNRAFQQIFRERQIERALSIIPDEVKKVKERAMSKVFDKELESADDNTRALIERMMDYMERKCVGIPIKVAKQTLAK